MLTKKKKGIPGYIGANTFLELGFAYLLEKPIYLLHQIPDQPNQVEIMGLGPIVLAGNVDGILKEDTA